jgi:hypothetical protein
MSRDTYHPTFPQSREVTLQSKITAQTMPIVVRTCSEVLLPGFLELVLYLLPLCMSAIEYTLRLFWS